jgi:hypothetical protein
MMASTPNSPTFVFDDLPLHWQMTRCEKYALASILEMANAGVAIEIGTYKGGSLQVISKRAGKVYSIDITPECRETLGGRFNNVEFITGDSTRILPGLLRKIAEAGEQLGFVLIDGNHSTEGVKSDINAVLKYVPIRPVYVVFHDSFHPPCREGILAADWGQCDYVHYVEIDFIPGVYHREAFDTARPKSMFGGLALALMRPEKRAGEITVCQSQQGLFEAVVSHSCHVATEEEERKVSWKEHLPAGVRSAARRARKNFRRLAGS